MECRLCLHTATSERFISIYSKSNSLVKGIWTCCRLQVYEKDRLPRTICPSCKSNLDSFADFKRNSVHSDEMVRLKKVENNDVKVEEVVLDDLLWESESHATVSIDDGDEKPFNGVAVNVPKEIAPRNVTPLHFIPEKIIEENIMMDGDNFYSENFMVNATATNEDYPNDNKFECDYCKKTFNDKTELESHIVSKLCNPNPHTCTICSKTISTKRGMLEHMRIHTGEKPYLCEVCSKGFISSGKLTRHRITHYGKKAHECRHCLKCFIANISAQQRTITNETVDKPIKTGPCPKCFLTNINLKRRTLNRVEEKPSKFRFCYKCFAMNGNLQEL